MLTYKFNNEQLATLIAILANRLSYLTRENVGAEEREMIRSIMQNLLAGSDLQD